MAMVPEQVGVSARQALSDLSQRVLCSGDLATEASGFEDIAGLGAHELVR